jgi:hypothetical protein
MNVKERIKKFIKHNEMSISDFEKSIFAGNGYINSISKNIGIDRLNLILEKYPNLNLVWLITGNGEMLTNSGGKNEKNDTVGTNTDMLLNIIKENRDQIKELKAENKNLKARLRQYEGDVSANKRTVDLDNDTEQTEVAG